MAHDEHPDLVEDGDRDQQRGEQTDLEAGEERLGDTRSDFTSVPAVASKSGAVSSVKIRADIG